VFGAGLLLLLFTPGLRAQGLLRAIDQLLLSADLSFAAV
jgi:hypothetical protein